MPIQILASDSKMHYRPSKSGEPFRGLIGVTLSIREPDEFRKAYDGIFDDLFKENSLERKRNVYKSSDLARLFPGEPYMIRGILRKIVLKMIQIPNIGINIYFFTLNLHGLRQKKVDDFDKRGTEISLDDLEAEKSAAKIIQLFGEPGSDEMSYVSVKRFFEKVSQYYPVICSYILRSFLSLSNCNIIMDGCSGYETNAWRELTRSNNNILIAPHGDEYNPFISTADIIARWIDEELKQSGIPLNNSGIDRLLHNWSGVTRGINTDHIVCIHLGNKDLAKIKPISKKTMDYFEHIHRKHPVYYVFQETKETSERTNVEKSPVFDIIINRVTEVDGSYCFWKPDKHARHIQEGDVAVIYGDNGFSEVARLINLKYPIEIWDLRE